MFNTLITAAAQLLKFASASGENGGALAAFVTRLLGTEAEVIVAVEDPTEFAIPSLTVVGTPTRTVGSFTVDTPPTTVTAITALLAILLFTSFLVIAILSTRRLTAAIHHTVFVISNGVHSSVVLVTNAVEFIGGCINDLISERPDKVPPPPKEDLKPVHLELKAKPYIPKAWQNITAETVITVWAANVLTQNVRSTFSKGVTNSNSL